MRHPKPEISRETAMKLWIEEHSEYAKEQVVLNNVGVVGFILKSLNLNPVDEDLFQIGMVGLVKAINTFDPDKAVKFTAYAAPIIRNEILMTFRKKRIIPAFSLDEECPLDDGESVSYADMIPSAERFEELSDLKMDFDIFLNRLNDKEKKIVLLSLNGTNQTEITQQIGVSQSQVSRILKGIRKKMWR